MSVPSSLKPPARASVFVDGNNFYHGLDHAGVRNQGQLSFKKIAMKLVGPRHWVELRYYVGQVKQVENAELYAAQRAFVSRQQKLDPRITFHMGRLEHRPAKDGALKSLIEYLADPKVIIGTKTRNDLSAIVKQHRGATVIVEKAVDVMLAVDLVICAERDEYDTAYILAADGDYTHAAAFVRSIGKKVFAVSALPGAQLASSVDKFINIDAGWVNDCYI
jgi:uncharacterized LabA/DUF88 family protein